MESFGSEEVKGQLNTLEDFLHEWRNHIDKAMKSSHKFARLHNQIVTDYLKTKNKTKSR